MNFEQTLKNRADGFYNNASVLEIEKKFYDAFDISEIRNETAYFTGNIGYKTITAVTLIQLIAILNKHLSQGLGTCILISGCDVFEVYEDILSQCIKDSKNIYEDVRELFGEE